MSLHRVTSRLIFTAPVRVGTAIAMVVVSALLCAGQPRLLDEPVALVLVQVLLFAFTVFLTSLARRVLGDRERSRLSTVASDVPVSEVRDDRRLSVRFSRRHRPTAAEIEQAAADWLVRFDAAGAPEEWAELDAWLDANPRHRAAFLRLAVAWRRADALRRIRPSSEEPDPDLLRPRGSHTRRRRMVLTDGSIVWLAAGTRVDVPKWTDIRWVRLLYGQAIFFVRQVPDLPFEVMTGGRTVRVTGTLFSVRNDSGQLEVMVASGEVHVDPPDGMNISAEPVVVSSHKKFVVTAHSTVVSPVSRLELWATFGLRLARLSH